MQKKSIDDAHFSIISLNKMQNLFRFKKMWLTM